MSVQLTEKAYEAEDIAKDILASPEKAYQKILEQEGSSEDEIMMDIYDEILNNQKIVESGEAPKRGGLYMLTGSAFTLSGASGLLEPKITSRQLGAGTGYLAGGLFLLKNGFEDAIEFYGEEEREKSFEMLGDLTVHKKEGQDMYRIEYDPV